MKPPPTLYGPVCHCGKPFRRRRKWYIWDGARCSNCGAVLKCVDGGTDSARFTLSASAREPYVKYTGATPRVMLIENRTER